MSAKHKTAEMAKRKQQLHASNGVHVQGRLWYAARVLRRFTADELIAVAETGNRYSVLAWLNKLRNAGYFRNTLLGGQKAAVWTLIRDTGPHCPSILVHHTVVWDHNTEKAHVINPPAKKELSL